MIFVVATHPAQTEKGLNVVSISVKYDCLYLANQGVYSVPDDAKLIYWPTGKAASRIDQTALQFKIGDPAFDVSHYLVAKVNYAYSCQVQYDFTCQAGQISCKYFADVFQSDVQNTDMRIAYSLGTQLRVKQTTSLALEFNGGNLWIDAYIFSTDVLPQAASTTPQFTGTAGFVKKLSWTHPIFVTKDQSKEQGPKFSGTVNTAPIITRFVSEFRVSPAQKTKLLVGELSDKESPKNITLATVTAQCSGQGKWIILPTIGQIVSQLEIGVDVPSGQANDTCVVSFNATDNDPISPLSVTGKVKVEVLSLPLSAQTAQSNGTSTVEDSNQTGNQQIEPKQEEQRQQAAEILSRWFPQPTPAQTAKFRDVPLILDAKQVSSAGILTLEFNRPVALNQVYLSQKLDQFSSLRMRRRLGTQTDQELVYKMISEAFDVQYKQREGQLQTGLLNYTVTDFRKAKEIDIQLNFNEPLYVSFAAEGDNRLTMDQLIVSLNDAKVFIDPNLDAPIASNVLQKEAVPVPRLEPVSKPVLSQAAQATTQAMVKVVVPSTLVMNILIGVSLKKLWSTVNLLQFINYINLWRLSIPANLDNFFSKARYFARGDWIPKKQILSKLHLVSKRSVDVQGLQNRFLFLILAIVTVMTILAVLLVYVCRRYSVKIVQFCQRTKQKIFWNTVIRYSIQTYLDFSITLLITVTQYHQIDQLRLYKALVCLLALKPLGYFILLRSRFDSLDQPELVSSIGTLYQGAKVTSFPAVCYSVIFLARRMIFAVTTVYAGRLDGGLTVGLVLTQLILFSCYLVSVLPQESSGGNLIELSSETLLTYCFFGVMACLAISEPKQQYFVGWLSVTNVVILVVICVAYLASDSVKKFIRWVRHKLTLRRRQADKEGLNRKESGLDLQVQPNDSGNPIEVRLQAISKHEISTDGANNMTQRQDESVDELYLSNRSSNKGPGSSKLSQIIEESYRSDESAQEYNEDPELPGPSQKIGTDPGSNITPITFVPVKTRPKSGRKKLTLDELLEPWEHMQNQIIVKKAKKEIQPHEEVKFSIDDLQVNDSTTKSIKRHYNQIKARLDEDFEKFKQQRLSRFNGNPIQSP